MKKKGPRKKSSTIHPVVMAMRRAGPVPADTVERLRLREWSAIESFAQGNATLTDLHMLRELLSMCACSIDFGIGPEAEPACREAAVVLGTIGTGQTSTALLRMDEAQIAVMRELQNYHDLQRAALTWGDYLKVIEKSTSVFAHIPRSTSPLS